MKKLAIVGHAPSFKNAPFDKPDWEIWGLNQKINYYPHFDLWFEMHKNIAFPESYAKILKLNRKKIISPENYPYSEAISLLGGKYFNNTISYMLVYAILKGYKKIGLWGVKLDTCEELRLFQKQNVREILFFAKGRDIDITIYDRILMKGYDLYGF